FPTNGYPGRKRTVLNSAGAIFACVAITIHLLACFCLNSYTYILGPNSLITFIVHYQSVHSQQSFLDRYDLLHGSVVFPDVDLDLEQKSQTQQLPILSLLVKSSVNINEFTPEAFSQSLFVISVCARSTTSLTTSLPP